MAFKAQKDGAKRRNIPFLFIYEEWIKWWEDNLGPDWFEKRGRGTDKYQMGRIGDTGPYSPSNTLCILHQENLLQCRANDTLLSGERHGMCKITATIARCIFVAEGPKLTIGKAFGVSRFSVANIKSGNNWRTATVGLKKGQTRRGRIRIHCPTPPE